MKKFILPILLFLMFIPFVANAETCDTDKITISSITVENKSDNVEELDEATANGKNINLNLSMSEVGDNIEYKFVVKNDSNEDYKLDKTSFNINSDYINYSFETDDNTNIVKANSSTNVILRVEYKNELSEDMFKNGLYGDNKTMTVQLSNENTINVPDTFKNPNTWIQSYILIMTISLIISGSLCVLLKKKKYTKFMALVIGTAIIIPMSVYALCKCDITIVSNIEIKNKKYNPCIFEVEGDVLSKGMEYTNGAYTYRYKQEYFCPDWCDFLDFEEDGWSVYLNEEYNNSATSIDSKLCSSVNNKPIVSMSFMFSGSNEIRVDLSNFDTSNVKNMQGMFMESKIKEIDFSHFDTRNVENMNYMFWNSHIENLDLSSFDISKLQYSYNMFTHSKAIKGYAKNQETVDYFNNVEYKPETLIFKIK